MDQIEGMGKIFYSVHELNRQLALAGEARKVVFTNGVFDLLHAGHIELLEYARNNGDLLIVGINDDASVKRLKGDERPIYPLAERMEVLSAVMYVDYIIPFSEDTPLQLINGLQRVDVLVKGGDYKPHEVVGAKEVKESGGKLLIFDFNTLSSTSGLLGKIKNRDKFDKKKPIC